MGSLLATKFTIARNLESMSNVSMDRRELTDTLVCQRDIYDEYMHRVFKHSVRNRW